MAKGDWGKIDLGPDKVEIEVEVPSGEGAQTPDPKATQGVQTETTDPNEETGASKKTPRLDKRIAKLTRKAKEAEEREQALARQLQEAQTKLAQAAQGRLASDEVTATAYEAQVTRNLELAQQAYGAAFDAGDKAEMLKHLGAMDDAKAELRNIAQWKQQVAAHKAAGGQVEDPTKKVEDSTQATPKPPSTKRKDRWLSKNDWFGQPSNEERTTRAKKIDAKLQKDGWDPTTKAYWKELDRRLAKRFPDLYAQGGQVEEQGEQTQQQQAAPKPKSKPIVGTQSRAPASKTQKVSLSEEDLRIAKRMNITPEEYALQRVKAQTPNAAGYVELGI